MAAEDFAARRRFPRIAAQHSVLLKRLGDEMEGFAQTKTIAAGGCSVISSERMGVGSTLELLIAAEGDVITARGSVVYENETRDGRFDVGVEFRDLSEGDAARIQQVLESPREEGD
ncbi:MAG TPA: PilZ domain-containing protein [Vicinamibacterales bacterium]